MASAAQNGYDDSDTPIRLHPPTRSHLELDSIPLVRARRPLHIFGNYRAIWRGSNEDIDSNHSAVTSWSRLCSTTLSPIKSVDFQAEPPTATIPYANHRYFRAGVCVQYICAARASLKHISCCLCADWRLRSAHTSFSSTLFRSQTISIEIDTFTGCSCRYDSTQPAHLNTMGRLRESWDTVATTFDHQYAAPLSKFSRPLCTFAKRESVILSMTIFLPFCYFSRTDVARTLSVFTGVNHISYYTKVYLFVLMTLRSKVISRGEGTNYSRFGGAEEFRAWNEEAFMDLMKFLRDRDSLGVLKWDKIELGFPTSMKEAVCARPEIRNVNVMTLVDIVEQNVWGGD